MFKRNLSKQVTQATIRAERAEKAKQGEKTTIPRDVHTHKGTCTHRNTEYASSEAKQREKTTIPRDVPTHKGTCTHKNTECASSAHMVQWAIVPTRAHVCVCVYVCVCAHVYSMQSCPIKLFLHILLTMNMTNGTHKTQLTREKRRLG